MASITSTQSLAAWVKPPQVLSEKDNVKFNVLEMEVRVIWKDVAFVKDGTTAFVRVPFIAKGERQSRLVKSYPPHETLKFKDVLTSVNYLNHREFVDDVLCKIARKAVKQVRFYSAYKEPTRQLLAEMKGLGKEINFTNLMQTTESLLQAQSWSTTPTKPSLLEGRVVRNRSGSGSTQESNSSQEAQEGFPLSRQNSGERKLGVPARVLSNEALGVTLAAVSPVELKNLTSTV